MKIKNEVPLERATYPRECQDCDIRAIVEGLTEVRIVSPEECLAIRSASKFEIQCGLGEVALELARERVDDAA